jgi:hypothetical protein
VRTFFSRHLSQEFSEAIGRVASGESRLVRFTGPAPIDWASRPLVTCEGRGDGGMDLYLGDMNMMAPTFDEMMSNIEALTTVRPSFVAMWRFEYWTPPSSVTDLNQLSAGPAGQSSQASMRRARRAQANRRYDQTLPESTLVKTPPKR